MGKRIEYTQGQMINGLEFIEEMKSVINPCGKKTRKAKFKCFCENEFIVQISKIRTMHTISCGCYRKKVSAEKGRKNKTHGDSRKGSNHFYLFVTWEGMKARCNNENAPNYKNYGARGITVYDEWVNDYPAFKKYILETLGERPKGKTLDRTENNGNYEPDNIQWSTYPEQGRNKRSSKLTEQDVRDIRLMLLMGNTEHKVIGDIYGVARTTISGINNNKIHATIQL